MTDFLSAQTSVPDWLMTYCRQLADVHYQRKLNRMYVHMLQGFLKFEPWNAKPPFPWRKAQIHAQAAGSMGIRRGTDPGWVPMNMVLPLALHDQIKHKIDHLNLHRSEKEKVLSMRTFLYTAVCWWCTSVYPYQGPGMLNDE